MRDQGSENLRAEALSCVRGDKLLFRDLSFALEPGQSGLVIGPNGVGKSSLLRLIAGLLHPFSGVIDAPTSIALCDDRMALDENLPLATALRFWAKLDGRTDNQCTNAIAAAGMDHLAEVPIRYFSTGQRQRARLARTFLSDAKLWLLDEPANGLDTASADLLGRTLQTHLDRGGMILAASHITLPIAFDLTLELAALEQMETLL
ncbi:heme ABC exporter ATP-binding protein CcmA [Parasphingorhabdus cellanae]|uniref:Heme ABC exporter ATP-binding protein CcmA n=1 Tax=Parasphingorhabdus cellanae TaxID=2806553 RepID=A0ABX7SZ14_9SPHN|nr:heme ABC exporter ATP-binding protein CcmA [Parasphingorhabdus cellanae]QTD54514.1 heme ABC exporter ATP-binding protein CcmA [Parasphingorhabdus cellanae]